MNVLKTLPAKDKLLDWCNKNKDTEPCKTNSHIHTPYSFSAFEHLQQAFELASEEDIKVLGINDFNTTKGYDEFNKLAAEYKIFPLFNIEFVGLWIKLKELKQRVNDPNNYGRTYFCGKGLDYPISLGADSKNKLDDIKIGSVRQTNMMIEKMNDHLEENLGSDIVLSYKKILEDYTKGQVRERHIAKALRIEIFDKYKSDDDKKNFLKLLYSGKETKVDITDDAAMENEIRSNLLKSGGRAFVEEDKKAFFSIREIIEIVLDAGGIPCYPVLLDDKDGSFTDFEEDKEAMLKELIRKKVFCVELIPLRNNAEILKEYVTFFKENKFIVTFGTEHNTPDLTPLTISCRKDVLIDDELQEISYKGSCVIAAHQYLRSIDEEGYVDDKGIAKIDQIEQFEALGNAVIQWFINH